MRTVGLLRLGFVAMLVGGISGCDFNSKAPDVRIEDAAQPSEEIVASDSNKQASPETEDLSVPEPSPSEPVTATMKFLPSHASDGTTVELLVAVRIARAHYLHASEQPGGSSNSLKMELTLPLGVKEIGDWKFPPPEKGRAGRLVYRNDVLLKRSLQVTSTTPSQTMVVAGKLHYQACTDELCWPRNTIDLSAPLEIRSPPR